MSKGTPSKGKHAKKKTHMVCRRCGKYAYHVRKRRCASCGYGASARRRGYAWKKMRLR